MARGWGDDVCVLIPGATMVTKLLVSQPVLAVIDRLVTASVSTLGWTIRVRACMSVACEDSL